MSQPISFRQRLTRNTVASIATNGWTMVLTFVQLPLVLRGLGAEAFGVWVLVQTFGATTGWLSIPAIGLGISGTRHVAKATTGAAAEEVGQSVGATLVTFLTAGVLFGIAFAVAGPIVINGALELDVIDTSALRVVGLAFGCQILFENAFLGIGSVLEGFQEVARARGLDAARKTAVAVAVSVLAQAGGGLAGVAVASAAATTLATALAAVALWRSTHAGPRRPSWAKVSGVVRYAGTVSMLTGTGVLHRTMDRTIAGFTFGPEAVAVVEIANQLQAGATAPLAASTYPVLSATPWLHSRGDRPALRSLLERTTRYSVLLTLPLVALGVVLAGAFIRVWVGESFSEAIGLTQVALVYVAVVAPLQAGSNLLQGLGEAGSVLRPAVLSVLVNLISSLVLVQVVGLVGVFFGTLVGAAVLLPMLSRSVERHSGRPMMSLARQVLAVATPPTLAAAGAAGVIIAAPLPDLLTIVVGSAVGGAAAALAAVRWSMDAEERAELLRALRPARPLDASP